MELTSSNDEFVQLQNNKFIEDNEVNDDHSSCRITHLGEWKSVFGSCDSEMETFNGKVIEIKPIEDDNDMCNMQTLYDVESDRHECLDHGIDTMCTGTEVESNMSMPVIIMPVYSQVNSAENAIASQCVHKTANNDVKAIVPANVGNADIELVVEEHKPEIASIFKSQENSDSVFNKEWNENEDAKNVDYTSKDADSAVGDSRDVQECKPSTDFASSLNFPNLTGVWANEETAVNVSSITDTQEIQHDYCVGVQSSRGDLKVHVTVQVPRESAVNLWDSETAMNPWDCGETPWSSEMNPWNSDVNLLDLDMTLWNMRKCDFCGKVCKTKAAMSRHLQIHNLYRPYPCDKCGGVYDSYKAFLRHQKEVHSVKKWKRTCTLCGMVLLGEPALLQHIKAHKYKNFRTYSCEHCNRIFTKETSFRCHLIYVHNMRKTKFTCETCRKKFINQDNLAKHMDLHRLEACSDERQYFCKVCGKKFDSQGKLNRHKTLHRLPFTCTRCWSGFQSLKRFIDHWEVHGIPTQPSKSPALVAMYSEASAKFTYVCTYCGEGFNESQKFIKHITEHPQSPVQRKSVHAAPSKLLNSAVVWSEMYSSLPYVCTSCGLGFGNPKLFKIHMRAHNDNPSSVKSMLRPLKLKSSGLTRDPFSEKYFLSPPLKTDRE